MHRVTITTKELGWLVQAMEEMLDSNVGLDAGTVTLYERLRRQHHRLVASEEKKQLLEDLREAVVNDDAEQLAGLRAEITKHLAAEFEPDVEGNPDEH